MDFPLGDVWFRKFYHPIVRSLKYSESQDRKSRDILAETLTHLGASLDLKKIDRQIAGSAVIVFGAGPSLLYDIEGLQDYIKLSDPFIIAADGSADALFINRIEPNVVVSDLDSCSSELLRHCSTKQSLFVHAHGDNIPAIRAIVHKLGKRVFGTTQVTSIQNVKNVGGFTDGDRACYLASYFIPGRVIIAGMDFGKTEGQFSKDRIVRMQPALFKRRKKLEWGKKSLEFLIQESSKIEFLNATKYGEEIAGARRVSYSKLT